MEQKRKKLQKEYASSDRSKPSQDAIKKQRDYALSSAGLSYRAHTYYVFNDPDFNADVNKLRNRIEQLYYPNISLETSYYDQHILQSDRLPIKELADKYRITLEDLGFYADGYFHEGYVGFGTDIFLDGGFRTIRPAESNIMSVYVIGKYTTLDDIRKSWNYVKDMSSIQHLRSHDDTFRKRSCDNPELIYAIFKARMRQLTFRMIFALYDNSELPLYHGGRSQFSNEESLERYYRKYAPKSFENDIDTARNLRYMHELFDDLV